MPNDDDNEEYFSDVINDIAKWLDNCYVIDLFHHAPRYDAEFHEKYFSGHMNAMGYLLTAHYIMTYIDRIIRHNINDFKFVQFIGSEYMPFME